MSELPQLRPVLGLRRLWLALACLLTLAVGVASLIPGPDVGGSDKFIHFLIYAILSASFSLIVEQPKSLLLVLIGLIGYGLLLEFLQGMTGYRMQDMADALANSLGVVAGLIFYQSPPRRLLVWIDRWLAARL